MVKTCKKQAEPHAAEGPTTQGLALPRHLATLPQETVLGKGDHGTSFLLHPTQLEENTLSVSSKTSVGKNLVKLLETS